LVPASGGGGALSATVTIPSIGDQYWNSTGLLLLGDGTNNGTTFVDSGPLNKAITQIGSAVTSTAQSKFGGSSLYFDGNNSGLQVGSAFDQDIAGFGAGDFTVETWFRTSTTARSTLFSAYRAIASATGFAIQINRDAGSGPIFGSVGCGYGDTTILATAGGLWSANTWHHVAVVRSGSTVTIFIDGVSRASTTDTTNISDGERATIGCLRLSANGSIILPFTGYLDDFRITKAARYTANFTPPTATYATGAYTAPQVLPVVGTGSIGGSGLSWSAVPASATATGTAGQIAYDANFQYTCVATDTWRRVALPSWDTEFSSVSLLLPMDTGTAFTDLSVNALTVTANGDARISTAQSKFGGASALFDGSGDFLSIPNNAAFDFENGDFAIEAWIYISANSTADPEGNRGTAICSTWNTGNPPISGWIFAVQGNSTTTGTGLQLDSWNGSNSGTLFRATASIAHSTWHHVAASVIGGTRRLYLNGTLLTNTQTITVGSGYTTVNSRNNALRIGGSALSSYPLSFNGYIDDLRITKGSGRSYSGATIPVPTAASGRS
jgi:hypothetical protein